MLFVKTFTGDDGKKVYYFKSVTVKKDGLEISVSSHYDGAERIKEALMKGKLLYRFDGGAQTEHRPAGVSVAASPVEEQGKGTKVSSAGKDTEKSSSAQGNTEKKDVVAEVVAAEADVDTNPTEAQKKEGKVFTVPAFGPGTNTDTSGVNRGHSMGVTATSGDSPQTFSAGKDTEKSSSAQGNTEKKCCCGGSGRGGGCRHEGAWGDEQGAACSVRCRARDVRELGC